ncbi:hypothetical protein HELRODRAFT_169168 [Helobdella robusta]|uniref:Endonuclease/exonuclease/phosphatase domain-containing protein n=1 Tax=Helobdella robusta TaxID=6412 RepID=T1F1I6_HELRO|nr:hypothetical protein HELRODRAFT_169168 [Helobdella robusta]ESO08356.1 hypothetical protein HELRODRAFT_169168 [Helobdella robusta]
MASFFYELISVLECVTIISSRILLAGDFNIHMEGSNNPNVVDLRKVLEMFQLINHIDEPTHIIGGTLDLIVTSHNIAVSEAKVYPSGIYSDHGLVQSIHILSIKISFYLDIHRMADDLPLRISILDADSISLSLVSEDVKYNCAYCGKVRLDQVQLKCGHRICSYCFKLNVNLDIEAINCPKEENCDHSLVNEVEH